MYLMKIQISFLSLRKIRSEKFKPIFEFKKIRSEKFKLVFEFKEN